MSIQTVSNSAITAASIREKKELVKSMIAKNCSDDEFELFAHVCERSGLDPFCKQIYAIMRKTKVNGAEVHQMTIQTGIDGLRLIADRTGNYCPGREATYTYDKEGMLLSATSYVKKCTKDGTWHEFSATAHFDEYCPMDREGNVTNPIWKKMGHIMLAKCAEALALRKGWPADMSGLYIKEEMDQADIEVVGTRSEKAKNSNHAPIAVLEIPQVSEADLIKQCLEKFAGEEDIDFGIEEYIGTFSNKPVAAQRALEDKNKDQFLKAYNMWVEKKVDELRQAKDKEKTA